MRLLLVLVLLARASAQEAAPPNPLLPLADAARAAPPEFCADILLRIAASKRADAKWKRELIEEAFRTAAQAQARFARRLNRRRQTTSIRRVTSTPRAGIVGTLRVSSFAAYWKARLPTRVARMRRVRPAAASGTQRSA